MSIRSRLLLLVLSVLLPATAAALWLVGQAHDGERRAVERNLRDTTRALSLVVDRELAQRAAIARMLALSRLLDDAPALAPQRLGSFEQQARRAMHGLGGWVELRSADGQLLSTTQHPSGGAGAQWAPGPAVEAQPGAATVAARWQPVDLPWIGPLERPPAGGTLRAGLVQPVQRDSRTLLNVTVTILPAELQALVDSQRLPAEWVGAVVDGRGTVVARQPGGAAFAGRAVTSGLKTRMAAAAEGRFESVSLDGVPVLAYFSTSPHGWSYVMAVPRRELPGALGRPVLQAAGGAALLIGLAVAGALWVARGIAEPVRTLKTAVAGLRAGQPVTYRSTGIAECDEVGAALAEAADAGRQARADLERQAADTLALSRDEVAQRVLRNQRTAALGRLTGGVAHDFNNLLGVISNCAHLIQRQATDPALHGFVAATMRAVEGGSRLTRQLLRFSGHQPVQPQPVDPGHHLPAVHELLKTVLGKRIEVSVRVAPCTRCISVDAGELDLALVNLALNARDALPAGGRVWLEARDAEPHDTALLPAGLRHVLITFSDDGVGLPEELAGRAFEAFFSSKAEGSGLGLNQVHGFCARAGGAVRLASTPGLGTTVSMVLPACEDVATPPT